MLTLPKKVKTIKFPRKIFVTASLLLFVMAFGASLFVFDSFVKRSKAAPLEEYAKQVVDKCSSGPVANRRACYEKEVPKLMDFISMEEAFEVVALIQKQDSEYLWCHNMGHEISEKENLKDPSAWRQVAQRCPVGVCSNGCIHGAIQEHFRSEALNSVQLEEVIPDLETLCEKEEFIELERASCYHEIGHISAYLTGAGISRAAEVCQRVATTPDGLDYTRTCLEGIFMQVFEPRDPEDFALVYDLIPRKDALRQCNNLSGEAMGACWEEKGWGEDFRSFCNQFEGETKLACFRESWVVQDKEKLKRGEGLDDFCSYTKDEEEKRQCYNKLYYALMSLFDFNEEKMKMLCSSLSPDKKGQCFANTASRMIEADKNLYQRATAICDFALANGGGDECYKELLYYSTFALKEGSSDFLRLCNALVDPWRKECLEE